MARLRLSVGTSTIFEATFFTRAVITVSPKDVGSRISYVGLTEAGDKAIRCRVIVVHLTLKHPGRNTFVIARDVRIVPEKRSPVDGKPSQNSNVLVV